MVGEALMKKFLFFIFFCIIAINDGKIKAAQISLDQQLTGLTNALATKNYFSASEALKNLTAILKTKVQFSLKGGESSFYTYVSKSVDVGDVMRPDVQKALHEVFDCIDKVQKVIDEISNVYRTNSLLLTQNISNTMRLNQINLKEILSKQIQNSNPAVRGFEMLGFNLLVMTAYQEFTSVAYQFIRDVLRAQTDYILFERYTPKK